jgi:hypothetical protein
MPPRRKIPTPRPRLPSNACALRIGDLTFVPPDTPGQFLAIRVPIGELVTRAAHSIFMNTSQVLF